MIATMRKTVCIDNIRSHTSGLFPYIEFNDPNPNVKFVTTADNNGNWGNFALDIAKVCTCFCGDTLTYENTVVCTSGITQDDTSIEARLRYCDLIRKYNFIQNQLRNGVFCKLIKKSITTTSNVEYGDLESGCKGNIETDINEVQPRLVTKFNDYGTKYDFIPMKRNWFVQESEFVYKPISQEELSEMEDTDTVNEVNNLLNDYSGYFVLLDDYNTVMQYELDWNGWIEKWADDGYSWGDFFNDSNYQQYDYFQFSRDFEKYCLGIIHVPETYNGDAITGILVPDYLNYTDIQNWLSWFEKNTVSAHTGQQEVMWNNMGGDVFYQYLQDLTTNWITNIPSYGNEEGELECRFTYLKPYISIPVCLEQTHDYELNYDNYIVDGEYIDFSPEGVFSGYAQFNETHFVYLEDSGMVESKLENVGNSSTNEVDGVVGFWKEFENSDEFSPIFRCTYHSGSSSVCGETVTRTKYYNDGHFEVEIDDSGEVVEEEPQTEGFPNPERIWLVNRVQIYCDPDTEDGELTEEDLINGVSAITITTAYTCYNYYWWQCARIGLSEAENIECADGELVDSGDSTKYRSLPMLSCIGNLVPNPEINDEYYFLPTYDNGRVNNIDGHCSVYGNALSTFSIPYENNTFFDMKQENDNIYVGNYIPENAITIEDGICTIHYVIGGKAIYDSENEAFSEIPETGIHYVEVLKINQGFKSSIYIDGYMDVEFFYDSLDLSSNNTVVYSEDYNMYRYARRAFIEGIEVGTTWTSNNAIIAKLFTREDTSEMMFLPVQKPDIILDRGNASAFERYFKLSECNTFYDLQQYGNNFFNL